jgi:hypothetical protein
MKLLDFYSYAVGVFFGFSLCAIWFWRVREDARKVKKAWEKEISKIPRMVIIEQ